MLLGKIRDCKKIIRMGRGGYKLFYFKKTLSSIINIFFGPIPVNIME